MANTILDDVEEGFQTVIRDVESTAGGFMRELEEIWNTDGKAAVAATDELARELDACLAASRRKEN